MIAYIERATKKRSTWLLLKLLKLVGLAGLVVFYISQRYLLLAFIARFWPR